MADVQTVIVGCKAPNGVILNLDRYEITHHEKMAVRKIEGKRTIVLRGFAHKFNEPDPTATSGGYRLTAVPADFWAEWWKINGSHAANPSPLIIDKIILPPPSSGADKATNGAALAREMAEVPKMNAPLDPSGDPRAGNVKAYKQDASG
jgi:hypothetical protein